MTLSSRPTEAGSAIILIFVAIAVFAALSYVVFSGSRQGAQSLSKDQARIAAQEILGYADSIAKIVQTYRLRGCADSQFDFYTPVWKHVNGSLAMTANANPTAVTSCIVLADAKVSTPIFQRSYFIQRTLMPIEIDFGHGLIAVAKIPGVGSASPDLIFYVPHLKDEVCREINKISGIQNPETIPTFTFVGTGGVIYDGTFSNTASLTHDDSYMFGKSRFCSLQNGQDNRLYYTLIAR